MNENAKLADLLEEVAERLSEDDVRSDDLHVIEDAIVALRRSPDQTIVEQMPLGHAPDGWAWDDLWAGPFGLATGYFSGIRPQKGEPIIEQDGHFLLLRQGEQMTERQVEIYRRLSKLAALYVDGNVYLPTPAVTVLVVHGFRGARDGYTVFAEGTPSSPVFTDAVGIREWIVDWLKSSHNDPIERTEIARDRKPEQVEIS